MIVSSTRIWQRRRLQEERRCVRGQPAPTEAMILVGGKGTRLQSVVSDRPKPMAEVGGRPFLAWLLSSLREQGVRRIVLCTGHLADVVEDYFGKGQSWGVNLEYSRDPFPLGTGGAVRHALSRIRGRRFLVLNGDSFCRFDLPLLVRTHREREARATLWLTEAEDCARYGSVVLGPEGQILAFTEKTQACGSGLVNAGVYLLERTVAEDIPTDRPVSLETAVFPDLIGDGLYGVSGEGTHLDIGTPESYATAEEFLTEEVTA